MGSRRRSAASRPPPPSRTPASEFRGALSDAPAPAARVPRWTGPSRDRAWRPGRRGAEDSGDLHSDRGGRPFSLLSRGRFASPDFTCELKCHLAATLRIGRGLEVLRPRSSHGARGPLVAPLGDAVRSPRTCEAGDISNSRSSPRIFRNANFSHCAFPTLLKISPTSRSLILVSASNLAALPCDSSRVLEFSEPVPYFSNGDNSNCFRWVLRVPRG